MPGRALSPGSRALSGGARLWIVDPSVSEAEVEGVQLIATIWPGSSRVFLPVLRPGDGPGPQSGYELDAVVVMGSRASANGAAAWQRELAAWLAPIVGGERPVPVLGICFGHQLLCKVAGGAVADAFPDGRKILVYGETRLGGSRLLPGREKLRVVGSHREIVTRAPDGFRVTGWREGSPIDAIEHASRPLFGVQFHPEAREEFVLRSGLDVRGLTASARADGEELLRGFARLACGPGPRAGDE